MAKNPPQENVFRIKTAPDGTRYYENYFEATQEPTEIVNVGVGKVNISYEPGGSSGTAYFVGTVVIIIILLIIPIVMAF